MYGAMSMNSYMLKILCAILCMTIILILIVYRIQQKKMMVQVKEVEGLIEKAIQGESINPQYQETTSSEIGCRLREYLITLEAKNRNNLSEKRELKSIISNIAHQITTPLTNIMIYTQLIEEMPEIPDEVKAYLHELHNQGNKIDFLLQSLVRLSRLETEMLQMKPAKYNILDILAPAIELVKFKAEMKKIKIILQSEKLSSVCDLLWTREAISNILDNCIKYSPVDSCIQIETKENDSFIQIIIKDEGIGIDQNEINQIFKRFYRSPSVKKTEGLGIGLYLTREIISAQGGYVMVQSEVGKGSSFFVFLPNL